MEIGPYDETIAATALFIATLAAIVQLTWLLRSGFMNIDIMNIKMCNLAFNMIVVGSNGPSGTFLCEIIWPPS